MKMTLLPMMLLTCSIAFAGCDCTAEQSRVPTDFAFGLYGAVAKEKPTGNLTVSPYCAELLLDFVRSGADGKTKAEIDKVLGGTGIQWTSVQGTESVADSPLTTAAALWTQQEYDILPEFLDNARKTFGASAEQADFVNNSADAVRQINKWCSDKTNGKITSLFDRLDASTR